jgi:hypothetical protein
MKRRAVTSLVAAAVAGLCSGASTRVQGAQSSPEAPKVPKHVCKGLNECKGQGACKHGCSGHGCHGKNDCRGQGGCAAEAAQHKCAGKNSCKAIGGCASGDKGCAGKNTCKGRGGCEVPLKVEHTAARKAASGQNRTIEPDLGELAEGKGLQVFNRSVSRLDDGARKGVRLNESPGDGIAYLQGIELSNGTIECDVSGKDVQQHSFVGVAFHGVDGATLDAIYFRPFNFRAEDPARRVRAVQYISHPTYTWQKLRAEQPGKYEQPVNPVPDPNGWFRARVVVESPKVSVFVGDAKEPSLVVNQLSDRKKGLVGLWVGNTSAGDFANFKIVPA